MCSLENYCELVCLPCLMNYLQHDCQEFLALLLDSLHEQLLMTSQRPLTDQSQTLTETYTVDLNQSNELIQCSTETNSSQLNNNSSHWTVNITLGESETGDTSQSNNVLHSGGNQSNAMFLEPGVRTEGKMNSKQAVMNEKDSDSTGSSTVTISNISLFGSEDSNQSTVSLHSSDSEHANTFKTLNLKAEASATALI